MVTWQDAIDLPDQRGWDELAFDLHEAAKSRTYLTEFGRSALQSSSALIVEKRDLENALLTRLSQLEQQHRHDGRRQTREAIEAIRENLHKLWDQFEAADQRYVHLRRGIFANLQRVREILDTDELAPRVGIMSYLSGRKEP